MLVFRVKRGLIFVALVMLCTPGRSDQVAVPARQDEAPTEPQKVEPADPVLSAHFTLPSEETLSYGVEWRLMRAGTAILNWSPVPGGDGRGWQTDLRLESTGFVSRLYKVDNRYTSLMDPELCVLSAYMKSHEGSRRRETTITFDSAEKKASYLERDPVKDSIVRQQEIDIPVCVHVVLGGLFLLRTLRLEPGQSIQIPISDGKKSVSAHVEAQVRETIKTRTGTHRTIRYEAFLFNNVLYRRSGHLYVWLTEDARRVPVQIRARLRFHIGTITLQLEKEERS
jgi:hypothetical protein